jgi:hypothetical protein
LDAATHRGSCNALRRTHNPSRTEVLKKIKCDAAVPSVLEELVKGVSQRWNSVSISDSFPSLSGAFIDIKFV